MAALEARAENGLGRVHARSAVRRLRLLALALGVAALPACSALLPAHSRSNLRAGERLCLEMLDYAGLEPYRAAYQAVFGTAPRPPGGTAALEARALGGSAAALVAGLAVDAVSTGLEREASRYEAQFAIEASFDQFWIGAPGEPEPYVAPCPGQAPAARGAALGGGSAATGAIAGLRAQGPVPGELLLQQRYLGIRLRRWVAGEPEPVFLLVLGIHPAYDQQMFRVAPLLFRTGGAKAKVLSDERWSWLPPFVLARLFGSPGHAIDTTVSLELDAYWKDRNQQLKAAKVAAVELAFPQYDIARAPLLDNPGGGSGWILAIPVSARPESRELGRGTFRVRLLVTERDASNAPQLLERAARIVSEQGAALRERIGESGER
jgi:hypothetical protein